jgi:hypothetical protein
MPHQPQDDPIQTSKQTYFPTWKCLKSLKIYQITTNYLLGATFSNWLLALPTNIRLGWKGLPGTNTQAYWKCCEYSPSSLPLQKSTRKLGQAFSTNIRYGQFWHSSLLLIIVLLLWPRANWYKELFLMLWFQISYASVVEHSPHYHKVKGSSPTCHRGIWRQCYKTFYGRKLLLFSRAFALGKL